MWLNKRNTKTKKMKQGSLLEPTKSKELKHQSRQHQTPDREQTVIVIWRPWVGTTVSCQIVMGTDGSCRIVVGTAGFVQARGGTAESCWHVAGTAGSCWLVTGTGVSCWLVVGSALFVLAQGGHCWAVSAVARNDGVVLVLESFFSGTKLFFL